MNQNDKDFLQGMMHERMTQHYGTAFSKNSESTQRLGELEKKLNQVLNCLSEELVEIVHQYQDLLFERSAESEVLFYKSGLLDGISTEALRSMVLEQTELEQQIAQMERDIASFQEESANVERFSALARKYMDYTVLTTPMLNEFVDKIVVHEAEKIDGERTQEVEIYLNYVGRIVIPEKELTPEEQAEQEKLREKRRKARESALRCYYRKKSVRPNRRKKNKRRQVIRMMRPES